MKESLPQKAYDELADSYAELIGTKPHNAYYDRPAMQSLVFDVKGKKILDAGCGPGVYTEWLINQGADVVGLDANENMIKHAIARNGDRARFIRANLEEPMTFFHRNMFDGILSPLTITYCKDLKKTFSEFSRILKNEGWFVFSTEHPFFSYRYNKIENYYNTKEVSCTWTGFHQPVEMKSYYHSLGTITDALTSNGFVIERILEPKPTDGFAENDREGYNKLLEFPLFICIRAVKRS